MNYYLRSKQTGKYIVEKDYCHLVEVSEGESPTEWTLEAAKQAMDFDKDLIMEVIPQDYEIFTNAGYIKVKGYDLPEYKEKFDVEVFYYVDANKEFVLTEKSSGARLGASANLLIANQALTNKLNEEPFRNNLKTAIQKHFKQKYANGIKVRRLNGTKGGMFGDPS